METLANKIDDDWNGYIDDINGIDVLEAELAIRRDVMTFAPLVPRFDQNGF